ncbi:MAG TPA: hypothetical protein GXX75_18705 [Clostridiales bacterium]|nr:hypothetical protein [Clostridiales bacterium]
MKKQIQGIALILFGIVLGLASDSLNNCFSDLGIGVSVPWVLIGLIIGIIGLLFVFLKTKDNDK